EPGRTAEFVGDLGELGHGLVESGHGQGLCARSQVMVPTADWETGVEDAADLRLAAFGAELLMVVLVGCPRVHGEFDDEGLALDLDSGEAAVMIGEFAGLAIVRQSPQAGTLGVLAVLASAFGGEDDRAVLAQGHGADGLVTAGDAAGPLTADVGEMREVGVPLGVEEGVLGDDATALIRQETLQAAGVEESGHSVVGRHSSILVLNRESGTDPVENCPTSQRGREAARRPGRLSEVRRRDPL